MTTTKSMSLAVPVSVSTLFLLTIPSHYVYRLVAQLSH